MMDNSLLKDVPTLILRKGSFRNNANEVDGDLN
jgi:hypothetical protein